MPPWAFVVILAAVTVVLVGGLLVGGQGLSGEYMVFGAAAVGVGLVVLILGLLDKSTYLVWILLLSFLLALRLRIGGLAVYVFDPILVAVYLVWIAEILVRRVAAPRLTLLDLCWIILLAWQLVVSFLSVHLPTAANGWLFWGRIFLVYFFLAHRLDRRGIWSVVWLLLAVTILQGGLGVLQFLTRSNIGSISDWVGGTVGLSREIELTEGGTLFRVRGTLGYDTALAHWLEMLIPIFVSLFLATRRNAVRLWLAVGVLLGTATLIVTFTRGAWFGLVAGIGVVLLLHARQILRRPRMLAAMGLALVLVLIAAVPFAGQIQSRLTETADDTLAVRTNLNRAALDVISDYPVQGIGLDNFPRVAPSYEAGYEWLAEGAEHKVHNLYLAMAVEVGLPGLVLFILVQGLALLVAGVCAGRARQGGDSQMAALAIGIGAGMVAAVVVHGLAAWGLLSYMVLPLWALLMGLLVAAARVCRGDPA